MGNCRRTEGSACRCRLLHVDCTRTTVEHEISLQWSADLHQSHVSCRPYLPTAYASPRRANLTRDLRASFTRLSSCAPFPPVPRHAPQQMGRENRTTNIKCTESCAPNTPIENDQNIPSTSANQRRSTSEFLRAESRGADKRALLGRKELTPRRRVPQVKHAP